MSMTKIINVKESIKKIEELRLSGLSYSEIADIYKVSRQNIHALIKRHKAEIIDIPVKAKWRGRLSILSEEEKKQYRKLQQKIRRSEEEKKQYRKLQQKIRRK